MNKLLGANFMRLKQSKVFWVCMLLSAGFALMMDFSLHTMLREGSEPTLDGNLFSFVPFIGIIGAAFISLFVGAEYSDGTIRNKIVIGHSRTGIYLANLITAAAAMLTMCLLYILVYTAIGTVIVGWFVMPLDALLLMLLLCAVLTVCLSAVMTAVVMLNQNKAVVAVLSIILALGLLFAGSYTYNRLSQPEYYGGYTMNEEGRIVEEEPYKNPRYLSGTTREVYQFFNDFLSGGQQLQLASAEVGHPWKLTGYSALITIVTTAAGVMVFRRKDLK